MLHLVQSEQSQEKVALDKQTIKKEKLKTIQINKLFITNSTINFIVENTEYQFLLIAGEGSSVNLPFNNKTFSFKAIIEHQIKSENHTIPFQLQYDNEIINMKFSFNSFPIQRINELLTLMKIDNNHNILSSNSGLISAVLHLEFDFKNKQWKML